MILNSMEHSLHIAKTEHLVCSMRGFLTRKHTANKVAVNGLTVTSPMNAMSTNPIPAMTATLEIELWKKPSISNMVSV